MGSKRIPALGYARVSSSGQAKADRDGLARQRRSVEAYAKAHGYHVEEWFEDRGVSGKTDLEGRAGLGALLHRVETNGVRVVLIERLDRLARDVVVQETLIAQIKRSGVTLESAHEGADLASDDPSRTVIRQIMGAIAGYDRAMLVLKLRAARDARRATGAKVEGRKHIGEIDMMERQAVLRIKQLRRKQPNRDRRGAAWIAGRLNVEGIPARGGAKWTKSKVEGVLTRLEGRT